VVEKTIDGLHFSHEFATSEAFWMKTIETIHRIPAAPLCIDSRVSHGQVGIYSVYRTKCVTGNELEFI